MNIYFNTVDVEVDCSRQGIEQLLRVGMSKNYTISGNLMSTLDRVKELSHSDAVEYKTHKIFMKMFLPSVSFSSTQC